MSTKSDCITRDQTERIIRYWFELDDEHRNAVESLMALYVKDAQSQASDPEVVKAEPDEDAERMYTARDIMKYWDVSESTINTAARNGDLKYELGENKVRGRRYKRSAVLEWIRNRESQGTAASQQSQVA